MKRMALVLVGVVIVSCLVGCGKKGNGVVVQAQDTGVNNESEKVVGDDTPLEEVIKNQETGEAEEEVEIEPLNGILGIWEDENGNNFQFIYDNRYINTINGETVCGSYESDEETYIKFTTDASIEYVANPAVSDGEHVSYIETPIESVVTEYKISSSSSKEFTLSNGSETYKLTFVSNLTDKETYDKKVEVVTKNAEDRKTELGDKVIDPATYAEGLDPVEKFDLDMNIINSGINPHTGKAFESDDEKNTVIEEYNQLVATIQTLRAEKEARYQKE